MTTEKRMFYKRLSGLVFPIAVQNLMTALVGASDALMLGFLNQSSLAAVSLASQIQFILNLVYAALTIGTTILAAQYWGKGDKESVEKILAIVLRISVIISAVFSLASGFAPGLLMRVFTNDARLIALGIPYLRIVSCSYLFTGVSQIYLCVMKNSGRALRSTVYGSASVILNIILNAVLIFGLLGFPKLGIQGAAIATTIARAAELILAAAEHLRKDTVRIKPGWIFRTDKRLKRDFYHYTAPVLANELVWGCGFTMFSVVMGHLGSDAVAANSIANIVKNMIACLCLGIGTGSGIIVGNELGSGRLVQAAEYGRRLCRAALAAGVLSGALLLICSPFVLKLYPNLTGQAKFYLQGMLYICSYYLIGKSINTTVVAGIFCAGGDTRFGLCCDTITMWVIIIPAGLITAFILKIPVLWVYVLLNLDEFVKLPAVYRHYKKYRWVRNLTEKDDKSSIVLIQGEETKVNA